MSLKDDCKGRWPGILVALGVDRELIDGRHHSCPICPPKYRDTNGKVRNAERFRFTDFEGHGNWICSSCGPGNGLQLLMSTQGWSFDETIEQVKSIVNTNIPKVERKEETADSLADRMRSFGSGLQKVERGDPVWKYLATRGLEANKYLRTHPGHPLFVDGSALGTHPVMAALFQAADGSPVGYHRTYLMPDGKKRLVMGRGLSGSAIRLSPVSSVIGLAEGIETALSVTKLFNVPCWAAYSAGNMKAFVPPDGVRQVRIYADTDDHFTGQLAAVEAAHSLKARGYDVVLQPFLANGDYNDKLLEMYRYGIIA